MKKYSLKFLDVQSELEYQSQRNQHFRMPIFKSGHYGMLVISIIKLILNCYYSLYSDVPAIIATQIYIILSLILVKYKRTYIQIALLFFNYSLMAYEQVLMANISLIALPLFINSFTICNILIILVLDVFESYFLIVTTFSYKLINTILADTQRSYNIYAATCILILFLCYCSRRLNFQSRNNFLLCQKDNLWEKILPKIVNQPFLLFSFDNEKIEFQYKLSKSLNFQCNNTNDLKNFLRTTNHQSQSLEDFFFKENQKVSRNEQGSNTIMISNKKVVYAITYSIFYYQQPIFLVQFTEDILNNNSKIIQSSPKQYKQAQFKLYKFFFQHLQKSICRNDCQSLGFLRNICYKQILNYKLLRNKKFKISEQKLESLIQHVQQLFLYKKITIIYDIQQLSNIKTLKYHFYRILFEIFQGCNKRGSIYVKYNEASLQFQYVGKQLNQDCNDSLQQAIKYLIKHQDRRGKNEILLQIYQEPLVPFI
ncbi:unnamed protein product [Paramecium pentaurelia]|uniref:Transmembrane protein n=1 Tax=Paramecium pentaurelia TaxID=43138 RepID=A0A8S1TI18_9CILI|nr:unnamed protein product [Paramecium pentaurelia]